MMRRAWGIPAATATAAILSIGASAAPCATHAGPDLFPIDATESVDIIGNGAKIFGDQSWIDFEGRVNNTLLCPDHTAGSHWIEKSTGFMSVGTFGQDNSAVDVSVSGLAGVGWGVVGQGSVEPVRRLRVGCAWTPRPRRS